MPINLADLSPQQEVAAVYLGYYDRAADPFGFSFWSQTAYPNLLNDVQSEPEFAGATLVEQEEEVLARIAQDFARQPETKAEYPFFQTPSAATATAFLNQVYQNLFNRPIDTGVGSGAEFWTPLLLDAVNNPTTADFSVGEIIIEIIKGAQEPDKSIVENKIEASLDWTENAALNGIGTTATNFVVQDVATGDFTIVDQEAYDGARDVIDGVDETPGSVADAKQETQDFIAAYNTPEPTTLVLGDDDLAPGGTYEADTVILNLDQVPPTMTVNAGLVIIKAQNEASPSPFIVDTSNWDVDEITVEDSEVDVVVQDIQGTDLNVEDDSDNPNGTTTFDFDSQALQGDTEINLGINEVSGSVVIQNDGPDLTQGLETVNLLINDPQNIESDMDSLQVQGLETLNVIGGNLGNSFSIEGPLDSSLMMLDGSGADGDLRLNTSDNSRADVITAIGGIGDDIFTVGNSWGSKSAQDAYDGNIGDDAIIATLTEPGTRAPILESIEQVWLDFQDDAAVDFDDVDGTELVKIIGMGGDADGVEIDDMDSTVKDVVIEGDISETEGEGGEWEIGFDDIDDDEADRDEVTVTWKNNTDETQYIDELYIDLAEEVHVVFDGTQEMVVSDDFDVGQNRGSDVGEVTDTLSFRNVNTGDGIIGTFFPTPDENDDEFPGGLDGFAFGFNGMHETDKVETLDIETTSSGDLYLGVPTDQDLDEPPFDGPEGFFDDYGGICIPEEFVFMADAVRLEDLNVTASERGSIEVGGIGYTSPLFAFEGGNLVDPTLDRADAKPAVELDRVNLVSAGAALKMGWIDGDEEGSTEGASVSEFNMVAADDALVTVTGIDVEDIADMNIEIGDDAIAGICDEIIMDQQGGNLTVSGAGQLLDLDFGDEAFAMMDFSGMTEFGVDVDFDNDDVSGATVEGTDQDDYIEAGDGDDILNGNDGDDYLEGNGGDDIINGGAGNDFIEGGSGNDTIDGGDDDDFIDGGNDADVLTGGDGDDTFFFELDGVGDDTGKSTNPDDKQDVITDFTPGSDLIQLEDFFGAVADGDFNIGVFNGDGVGNGPAGDDVELFGAGPGFDTKVVIRIGDYNEEDLTFNFNSDGEDLQVLFEGDQGFFDVVPDLGGNGSQAFNVAEYEIGLLGAADKLGSLDTSDFSFI